jgi:cytidylate kinase
MTVITITGMTGSGATEVGAKVARATGYDYVDRLILAEAARVMGTSVAAMADRTERSPTLSDRLGSFFRTVLERSAMAGSSGDPYYGAGTDALLVREYRDIAEEGDPSAASDAHLLEVTRSVITDLASAGNVVIIGRGSNLILKDWPGVLHVGLEGSKEMRIQRLMEREQLDEASAGKYLIDTDRGREAYFRRLFHEKATNWLAYDLILNTDRLDDEQSLGIIVQAAGILAA